MMSYSTSPKQQGFSLVELAVGLVIIGFILGSLIVPVSSYRDNARRAEADSTLKDIHDALIGFAINNSGRLPCPASLTSDGVEAISGSTCTQQHGFVPAVSLGLQGPFGDSNTLTDPWGNPYRYSLSQTASYQVCSQSGCPNAASILATGISAVIFSTAADLSASADQSENIDGDNRFVKQELRDGGGNNAFDDHITWVSPNILTLYLRR